MSDSVTRSFVTLPQATVHYASAGEGEVVLLLHQTPRSWDEYRDVLPLLGRRRRAIAMDTVGFGDSTALPPERNTVEDWAEAALAFLDALGVEQAHLVGHHTGAVIAAEMASRAPERALSVVLSSAPFDTPEERAAWLNGEIDVDEVEPSPDGSHVLELWRIRAGFYPEGSTDLLERFLVDALKAGQLAGEGHKIVARYDVPAAARCASCPILIVGATGDPYAYPALSR